MPVSALYPTTPRPAWQRAWRLIKHRWAHATAARRVPHALLQTLAEDITRSEMRHGGEIHVHIEAGLPWRYVWRDATPRERARRLFGKLGLWDTPQRNGVLIYLLLADHAIELVADRGLCAHVQPQRWDAVVAELSSALRAGQLEQGLRQAVGDVSALLEPHFPASPADTGAPGHLPDTPSTSWTVRRPAGN